MLIFNLATSFTYNLAILRKFRETGSNLRRQGQGSLRTASLMDEIFPHLAVQGDQSETTVQVRNLLSRIRHVCISDNTVRKDYTRLK